MEEDKPVVNEIQPLHWPGGSKPQPGGFFSINPNKRLYQTLNIIEKHIVARPPIPPEIWGPDPRRQQMGAFISKLIGECIVWQADRFIPDDPLEIVFSRRHTIGDDDMDFYYRIEEEFQDEIDLRHYPGDFDTQTIGDLVDYCLLHARNWPIEKWHPDPTGNVCPTFSAFYDIRRFLCSRYSMERKSISPSTPLSVCKLVRGDGSYMNQYLEKRFEIKDVLHNRYLGKYPIWSSVIIHAVIFFVLIAFIFQVSTIGGMIMTVIISFLLGSSLVASDSWGVWRKGLRTFRDLVEYVVEESKEKTPVG